MRPSCMSMFALLGLMAGCHLDVGGKLERDGTDATGSPHDGGSSSDAASTAMDAGSELEDGSSGTLPLDGAVSADGGSDGAVDEPDAGNVEPPPSCTPGSAAHGSCGFAVRRRISFDALLLDETVENIPVLLVLDATRIDYSKMQADGRDLRFVDQGGRSVLAHEIERWDPNGKSYVWVKVPRITAHTITDHIFMVYGNPDAVSAERPRSVWSNGYIGVWHLADVPNGAGSMIDSTGAHPGTASAKMDATDRVEGKVAFGSEFDGTEHTIDLGAVGLTGATSVTLEAWVRNSGKDVASIACQTNGATEEDLILCLGLSDQKIAAGLGTQGEKGDSKAYEVNGSANDAFAHLAITWSAESGALRVYRNGQVVQTLDHGGSALSMSQRSMTVGSAFGMGFFKGILDEVRLSRVARPSAWLAATVASMNDQSVSYGFEEAVP